MYGVRVVRKSDGKIVKCTGFTYPTKLGADSATTYWKKMRGLYSKRYQVEIIEQVTRICESLPGLRPEHAIKYGLHFGYDSVETCNTEFRPPLKMGRGVKKQTLVGIAFTEDDATGMADTYEEDHDHQVRADTLSFLDGVWGIYVMDADLKTYRDGLAGKKEKVAAAAYRRHQ